MREILGDGLNGLIFGFYNPDFVVRCFEEHPRPPMDDMVVLHDTLETRKLCHDLGLAYTPREKPMRYYFNGQEYPFIPEPVLSGYVLKKLGGRAEMLDKDRTLSQPGSTFRYLDTPVSLVEERLRQEVAMVPMVPGRIEVDPDNDVIVSTLPAPVFWSWYRGHKPPRLQLLSNPSTFEVSDVPPEGIAEDFAWLYFADQRPYHRVGHVRDKFIYEYAGLTAGIQVPMAVLKSDPHNVPPPGVIFCGRQATWKHWWKLQHTVRLAKQRFEWEKLWSRQAYFETFHMDLGRDIDQLTDDTIYYIVSLESELHEMLRELKWKRWKPGQPLNRDRVLEEYVDALKFMLTLGCMWGFTPDEVFGMFQKKSAKVEKEYFDVHTAL